MYSASVLEGESDIVVTNLITDDADTDKINTDSMIHLVSAIGMANSMDGMFNWLLSLLDDSEEILKNALHIYSSMLCVL